MLVFKELTITFNSAQGSRRRGSATALFNGNVRTAQAVLKGYNIRYTHSDHPVLEQEIDLDTQMNGARGVDVFADFALRDSSGLFDDAYQGWVNVVVIADVA